MQFSLAVSICISVVTVLLSQLTVTHDILLKDGRKIQVEDYWEEDGQICFEKHDTIVRLNKNRVKKIIFIDSEEMARRKKMTEEKKADMKKKYTSDGAIVLLNDGSSFEAKATWVKDGLIACKTDTTIHYFEENEVREIVKAKMPDTPNLSNKIKSNKRDNDPPASNFFRNKILYIFIGYSTYRRYPSKACYTQWYKTEIDKLYYWDPYYKKFYFYEYRKPKDLSLAKPAEFEEPPEYNHVGYLGPLEYLGKIKLSDGTLAKRYKSENWNEYYWDSNCHRMRIYRRK